MAGAAGAHRDMEEVHQEEAEGQEATEIDMKSHHETHIDHAAIAEADRRQGEGEAEVRRTLVAVAVPAARLRSEAIVEVQEAEAGVAEVVVDAGVAATLATAVGVEAAVPAEIVAEGGDERSCGDKRARLERRNISRLTRECYKH